MKIETAVPITAYSVDRNGEAHLVETTTAISPQAIISGAERLALGTPGEAALRGQLLLFKGTFPDIRRMYGNRRRSTTGHILETADAIRRAINGRRLKECEQLLLHLETLVNRLDAQQQ